MKTLKLGVIGMSDGNGHPYSWSSIFNGYEPEAMQSCPFPSIPAYLAQHRFPDEAISGAQVTHVWTQDDAVSRHIAACARIPHVVSDFAQMVGKVDAVLLARDDAENHPRFAEPFFEAGIPLYIDKPLALSVAAAKRLLARQKFDTQVFSCSALRYAREFTLEPSQRAALGAIKRIDATTPKSWAKYAVHVIEPTLVLSGFAADDFVTSSVNGTGEARQLALQTRSGVEVNFTATGPLPARLAITIYGTQRSIELVFSDSFTAFRTALQTFIQGVRTGSMPIPRRDTLDVVNLIERGLS